jgi:pimeloyl-ACP methyl ester carboxylesterase
MLKKTLKWIFKVLITLIIIILIYGSIKQWNYDSKVQKEYPPTGEFSDIGNNKVHYDYSNQGDITFVLVAGLGETMYTWSTIKDELNKRGRVFMYDRSGLGNSEEGILPRSIDNIANELQTILKNESIPGPYILVGHSAGGLIIRYFAKKYPENVQGLFLIDPYQEMGREEFGEWPLNYKLMNWSLRNLSWSGIPFYLLPNPPHPTYKTSKAIRTYGYEAFSDKISLQQFAKLDTEKSYLPIYLLTTDKPDSEYNDLFKKWNQKILDKYSHEINKHVIIESGHHIHIEKPQKVLNELDEFLSRLITD